MMEVKSMSTVGTMEDGSYVRAGGRGCADGADAPRDGLKGRASRRRTRRCITTLIAAAFVAALSAASPLFASQLDSLLESRSATFWYEGEALGDLIIGARAQFTFVYVDGPLSQAVVKDQSAPEWLRDNVYFFGGRETKKKALFIVRLHTRKNLDLDLSTIRIGSHSVTWDDVLTNRHYVPAGELPADFSGDFAVAVPIDAVKGAARRVSVGDYGADLEFPVK